jgi:hypothetical protein
MNFSQIASKLRHKITQFSGELSKNLDKTCRRFVSESIYGILSKESVMLSEIGRSLPGDTSLKKIEERLCRQLAKAQIKDQIHQRIARLAADQVADDTLLVLDLSDVTKKYARSMEYMAQVRDGSEGAITHGYWTVNIAATGLNSDQIIPLYHRLYSQKAPGFESENDEILQAIQHIAKHLSNRGIWVMDRGADRETIILPLLRKKRKFIIRQVGNRDLLCGHSKASALSLAHHCPCPYSDIVIRMREGKEQVYRIEYGYLQVHMPERPDIPLWMLVVKGLGEKPMMLLTSIPLRRNRRVLNRILRSYIKRWSIEETIRYLKQSYDFENIRVLSYTRLQNMAALLLAAIYFVAVVLDAPNKLKILTSHILQASRRIFGIPDFKYYAISDGLNNIFNRCPGPIKSPPKIKTKQGSFDFG